MGFKRGFFAPLTFLSLFFLCQNAAGETQNIEVVREFLERTPLSAAEQTDILEAVRSVSPRREWVLSGDGKTYSLVLLPVQKDERPDIQTKLEEMARTRANLRAHHLLYLRACGAGRKTRYMN